MTTLLNRYFIIETDGQMMICKDNNNNVSNLDGMVEGLFLSRIFIRNALADSMDDTV
jgi:hypothetical protein